MIFAIAAEPDLILGYAGPPKWGWGKKSFGHAVYSHRAYAVGIPAFHGVDNGLPVKWGLAIVCLALGALVIGVVSLRTERRLLLS